MKMVAKVSREAENNCYRWQELLPALVSCVIIFTILPGIAEGGPRHKQAKLKVSIIYRGRVKKVMEFSIKGLDPPTQLP